MSKLSIKMAERNIVEHLLRGGSASDEKGQQYLVGFATTALNDSSVLQVAKDFGITHQDICEICAAIIKSLMPNPSYGSAASRTLVSTLIFMESFLFQGLASTIHARTKDMAPLERSQEIASISAAVARQTSSVHKAEYGEPPFVIQQLGGLQKGGCLGLLLVNGLGLFAVGRLVFEVFC
jgi:hypothetical protein